MPIGIITNSLSIILGGIMGTLVGKKLPHEFKSQLTLIFGVCAMGMGIRSIGEMQYMPAVILAVVVGTGLGLMIKLGKWINKGAIQIQKPVGKILKNQPSHLSEEEFISTLVTVVVLFCTSGTGIYGSLDAGMTGDSTILISKSILDFFTAAIFASNLGFVVSIIAIPQFVIFFLLFIGAQVIFPLTTPAMIADFKACGGFLMIATSFRMMKLKEFPVADMIPAMVLIMPFSWFWVNCIMPLL